MKPKVFVAGAMIAGFLSAVPAWFMLTRIADWAPSTSITNGTRASGGSHIARIGFKPITSSGLGTAIGMNAVNGMTATDGKPMILDGRVSTILIGPSIVYTTKLSRTLDLNR